jgi:hypothetical protein
VLAALSVAAFVAGVRAAWRTAAALSVAPSAYLITVAAVAFASTPAMHIAKTGGTTVGPGLNFGFDAFTATPGFLSVGALAACLATWSAVRARQRSRTPRTWGWLAAAAALAAVFVLVGDGSGAQGGGSAGYLHQAFPPRGAS